MFSSNPVLIKAALSAAEGERVEKELEGLLVSRPEEGEPSVTSDDAGKVG